MGQAGKNLVDQLKFVVGFGPQDVDTLPTEDYVSFKHYGHWTVILTCGVVGGDIDVTLKQATAVSGTGEKELIFATDKTWQIADYSAADTLTSRTVTSSGATGSKVTIANATDDTFVLIIEVDEEDLDVDNDFDCMRVDITDPAAASFVSCLYIGSKPKFSGDGTVMPSAIVD